MKSEYENMWTTDKDNYRLIEVPNLGYSIFRIDTISSPIIENDELAEQVINEMLEAGVEIVKTEDWGNFVASFVDNLDEYDWEQII